MFHETIESFDQLSKLDELERQFSGMRAVWQLVSEHRWLGTARSIAEEQGFFHWELDFAQIFNRGGFDLQVGNPPWVRPVWEDDVTLAEFEPCFLLQENMPDKVFNRRRESVLKSETSRNRVPRGFDVLGRHRCASWLGDRTRNAGWGADQPYTRTSWSEYGAQ